MGDWYVDQHGKWAYDERAPSAGTEATQMMPAVPAPDQDVLEAYEHRDGAIYGRIDPGWFDSYDTVDSRTIADDGGPDAA